MPLEFSSLPFKGHHQNKKKCTMWCRPTWRGRGAAGQSIKRGCWRERAGKDAISSALTPRTRSYLLKRNLPLCRGLNATTPSIHHNKRDMTMAKGSLDFWSPSYYNMEPRIVPFDEFRIWVQRMMKAGALEFHPHHLLLHPLSLSWNLVCVLCSLSIYYIKWRVRWKRERGDFSLFVTMETTLLLEEFLDWTTLSSSWGYYAAAAGARTKTTRAEHVGWVGGGKKKKKNFIDLVGPPFSQTVWHREGESKQRRKLCQCK